MSDRSQQLNLWLEQQGYRNFALSPASEDASFRRYWRVDVGTESLIVMDAPPQLEPCSQFIKVAAKLRAAGLNAPQIIAQDQELGFLVLTDFGSSDYLSQLDSDAGDALYADALAALSVMQTEIDARDLPPYDEALLQREMDLFDEWFLRRLLQIELDRSQRASWQAIKQTLVINAQEQSRVFVHRDYHSRNLMWVASQNPGILDFQDAVAGPLTYDLVSLLRDCYVAWPPARVDRWALDYYQTAFDNALVDVEPAQFMRWFNLMGVQRHLKAIGIFSRLKIRDGKAAYIRDIPRTFEYLSQISAQEASIADLRRLFDQLNLGLRVQSLSAAT